MFGNIKSGRNRLHSAKLATIDQSFGDMYYRMKLPVESLEDDLACLTSTSLDLTCFSFIAAKQLLDQYVLASTRCFDSPLRVFANGERNVHGINVIEVQDFLI